MWYGVWWLSNIIRRAFYLSLSQLFFVVVVICSSGLFIWLNVTVGNRVSICWALRISSISHAVGLTGLFQCFLNSWNIGVKLECGKIKAGGHECWAVLRIYGKGLAESTSRSRSSVQHDVPADDFKPRPSVLSRRTFALNCAPLYGMLNLSCWSAIFPFLSMFYEFTVNIRNETWMGYSYNFYVSRKFSVLPYDRLNERTLSIVWSEPSKNHSNPLFAPTVKTTIHMKYQLFDESGD